MSGETSVDIVWEPAAQLSSLDCWDYSIELDCLHGPEDLQLAAELGKTLLERNKELENCIKLHQCTIDDQAQEIEYMKKQTTALREVNDSRLKIYEQLEVSIQDLERANHRLAVENANDKKQMKSQSLTIDTLESRVDELQKKYDEVNARYESLVREQHIQQRPASPKKLDPALLAAPTARTSPLRNGSTQNLAASPRRSSPDVEAQEQQLAAQGTGCTDEDMARMMQQLQEARYQRAREQKRVTELKEQVDSLLQEHALMEEQLGVWKTKVEDMKNLQDEINTLEEVRQGHLCGRCLRITDSRSVHDDLSVMLDQEEDEISLAESLAESVRDVDVTLQELNKVNLTEEDNCNPYRVLVEKYEALLKVQQNPSLRRKNQSAGCMSLQEELQMSGEFSTFNSSQFELESNHENSGRGSGTLRREGSVRGSKKPFSGTPTDFSEAETSSSGFSDETSNKATQTEGRPGSFVCSIADEDCKFSIYDDSSSFESRFHKTPEYRQLFSEIFDVLKRAAVAKDEGTELPLLEEAPGLGSADIPLEDTPSELTDDTRSVASLAVSSVASEPVFRVHTPVFSRKLDQERHPGPKASRHQAEQHPKAEREQRTPDGRRDRAVGQPRPRQPLEYLSVQVRVKGSSRKAARRCAAGLEASSPNDLAPTPNPRVAQLKGSGGGGNRKKFRPLTATELSDGVVWNGNTAHFYPSKSPRGRHQQNSSFSRENFPGQAKPGLDYKPGTASEEVAKLRRLEMSYAEALRMPNKSKESNSRHRKHH